MRLVIRVSFLVSTVPRIKLYKILQSVFRRCGPSKTIEWNESGSAEAQDRKIKSVPAYMAEMTEVRGKLKLSSQFKPPAGVHWGLRAEIRSSPPLAIESRQHKGRRILPSAGNFVKSAQCRNAAKFLRQFTTWKIVGQL
jgi:hypothetical protein